MKRTYQDIPRSSAYAHYRRPYPNAADPQYFMDRIIDGILGVVTVMGALSVFLFLITL